MDKSKGFTLIELMIGLALIGIALMLAAPSYTEFVKKNRLTSQANSFIIAVNLARSEAIKLNFNVILCPSSDGATCTGGNWEAGWLVYVDADGSGTLNGGDTVLRVFQALSGGDTLRANNPYVNRITYTPRGFATVGGSLALCDDRGAAQGKGITISRTGRPRLTESVASCTP